MLDRKPDVAGGIENQGMRIARAAIRHLELLDAPGCRIELADMSIAVAGVPDQAVGADDQVVRARAPVQVVTAEFAAFGSQVGDIITALADKPYAAALVDVRVARCGFLPRHQPLADVHGLCTGRGRPRQRERQA